MKEYRSAPLTESALNPDVLRITFTPFIRELPSDAIGGSTRNELAESPLTLHWREVTASADLPTTKGDRSTFRGFLRHRGELTKRMFADATAAPGDVVIFEQLGSHEFLLHVEKPNGERFSGAIEDKTEAERIRTWAMRETRPDQQKFRREIAERDGLKCAVTGCEIEEILDAAHLAKRAPGGFDDPSNGMILRADIHRLFDAGLLRIDPMTRTVVVGDLGADATYNGLSGRTIRSAAELSNLLPTPPVAS